jgi:hypothetical protein
VRSLAIADASFEAAEGDPADIGAPQVHIRDAESGHVVLVMIAVHGELGEIDLAQVLDPRQVEVAAADHRVGIVALHPSEQVAGRRGVSQDEQPHLHVTTQAT